MTEIKKLHELLTSEKFENSPLLISKDFDSFDKKFSKIDKKYVNILLEFFQTEPILISFWKLVTEIITEEELTKDIPTVKLIISLYYYYQHKK